ncbi:hypothetical protein J437_LFUL011513 [Ladona fulva]|uniref:Coiled-coil domain-containing protein 86 n=1 Tax=Ladona fulva TaxID=123851 RepID=A0A8K0P2R0_LADFU|nr:hypothetical protein J437_LFUL011513 [Ladona fulva]
MTATVNPSCVLKFEELICDKVEGNNEDKPNGIVLPEKIIVPKGCRKSGKFWKENRERSSSLIKTRGLRKSWHKKEQLRQDLKRVKEKSKQLKQEYLDDKEARKQRRRENLRRQEENRKRSEIVQVIQNLGVKIKNTSKIKRMKKKHLRNIEKRDTLVVKK